MQKENILVLHGAMGAAIQMAPLTEKLSRHFHSFSFNFSGHGGQKITSGFSISTFVHDTLRTLDELGWSDTHILGYSMGGYVALQLARDEPKRVNKIITLGTKLDWSPESTARQISMMNPQKIETKVPGFAQKLQDLHAPADWKTLMEHTAEMMSGLGSGPALQMEDFKRIDQEVLICRCTNDQMVTREESEAVVRQLPKGQLHELQECNHAFESVDADQLLQVLYPFLKTDIP